MTEEQWLASTDMQAMLDFLFHYKLSWKTRWVGWITTPRMKLSGRRQTMIDLGLFRCAITLLGRQPLGHWLPLAQRHALNPLSGQELLQAQHRVTRQLVQMQMMTWQSDSLFPIVIEAAAALARILAHTDGNVALLELSAALAAQVPRPYELARGSPIISQHWPQKKADVLREIVGNPFHPAFLDSVWLLENDGAVKRLAQEMAASGDYSDMPILQDALQDAGCTNEAILDHCRSSSHHPGCWLLDLLLGR